MDSCESPWSRLVDKTGYLMHFGKPGRGFEEFIVIKMDSIYLPFPKDALMGRI